jgi:hypothetical protein
MTDGVDARVNRMQVAGADHSLDRAAAQPEPEQLPMADHAVLAAGRLGHCPTWVL